jgi:sn-glycerol 3-phosphate transport system substrate-binding protein
MQRHLLTAVAAIAAVGLLAGTASAATEIQWWHAMTGANNDVVNDLTKQFNASQSDYKVTPVFKGSYAETLQAGIAAFRAKQAPTIIQVFDVGTGVMMNAEGAVVPVAQVLEKGGAKFDKSQYLPGIVSYYSKPDGTMLSFPYNSSSPILYYNKDILQKAGVDPSKLKTWQGVFDAARQVVKSGAATCGYTSTWLTWIHLENFAAWNNLQYGTNENGLGGTMQLTFNSPVFVKHIQDIADLAKEKVYKYAGRTSESKTLFTSGECAILTESSGGLGDIIKAGINYGTGPLPYDTAATGPQNTVPGGASLWVMAGHTDDEVKAAAAFFKFLSQTPIQEKLHEVSGYLPVTMAAYQATKASGFYDKNPGREQPILQMTGKEPTANSKGVRAAILPQLRDIQDEEFEAMLAGKQDAKTALDNAVRRGNEAIRLANGS